VDDLAATAIAINADLNGVALTVLLDDILDRDACSAQIVPAGDVFYEPDLAKRILPFLERSRAAGSLVLIGDPHRAYLPTSRLETLATYQVPDARALEDTDLKPASVYRLA
jgi:predicted nicotinamide N-methyase